MLNYADIGKMLNLKANYVRDKLVKRVGFPRPAVELSQKTRFWDEGDIDLWLRSEKRKLNK
jgi:predicted DNA-binding transcriptional regulator AlpA